MAARGTYDIKVLYEDNHVICAVKPSGILSQEDSSGAPDMLSILKRYIKEKYKKQGDVYLGLVHRLDRPVGGVMVFARTSKAAGRLSEQIRNRTVKKTYLAVLNGVPDAMSGHLEHRIKKDRNVNLVRVSEAGDIDKINKEYASLEYMVITSVTDTGNASLNDGAREAFSLVRTILHTGRPHQIRAQFAYIGHPIVGDRKYGAGFGMPHQSSVISDPDMQHRGRINSEMLSPRRGGISSEMLTPRRISKDSDSIMQRRSSADIVRPDSPALWAASFEFLHPVRRTPVKISAPPPQNEYPWNLFKDIY